MVSERNRGVTNPSKIPGLSIEVPSVDMRTREEESTCSARNADCEMLVKCSGENQADSQMYKFGGRRDVYIADRT